MDIHQSAVGNFQADNSAKKHTSREKIYVHMRLVIAKMADILYDMIEDLESEDRNLPTP